MLDVYKYDASISDNNIENINPWKCGLEKLLDSESLFFSNKNTSQ